MCPGNLTQGGPQGHQPGPQAHQPGLGQHAWMLDASPQGLRDDVKEQAYWVENIKVAQKSCAQVRRQWRDYCDGFGGGTRDPRLHRAVFLQGFFLLREQGAIPALPIPEHEKAIPEQGREDNEAHGILAAKVKRVQRHAEVRQVWASHCDRFGFTRNPLDHPCSSLHIFMAQVGMSVSAERDPYSIPAAYAPTDLTKFVKKMQSMKFKWKHQWDAYCDTYGGGVRDPQRHPEVFLQGFICITYPKSDPSILQGVGDVYTPETCDQEPFECHGSIATGVADYVLRDALVGDDHHVPTTLPFAVSTPTSEHSPAASASGSGRDCRSYCEDTNPHFGHGPGHHRVDSHDSGKDTGSVAVGMVMSF